MGLQTRQLAAIAVTLSLGGGAAAQTAASSLHATAETIMAGASRHFRFPDGLQKGLAVKGTDVWSARGENGAAGLTIMAGSNDGPESIILALSPTRVESGDAESLMQVAAAVLQSVDPTWDDALAWAIKARSDVWSAYGEDLSVRPGHYPTVSENRNGVIVEVAGLPGEFVQYVITTREGCTISSGKFENKCVRRSE